MAIRALYLRTVKYLQRHGLKSSVKRLWREARNKFRYNRDILFHRDMLLGGFESHPMPENCRVEKFDKDTGMPERLSKRIGQEYSEELLQEYVHNRFETGACLWCLMNDTEDMSYLWTLKGRAMKPYYFPLTQRDLYVFDGFTFPAFRGKGLNCVVLDFVLKHFRDEGFLRAYLETHEWNSAVIKMVPKNGFVRLGLARKKVHRGKVKVTWWY
jgi:GNAT superfamily N-acetyltransferase